MARLQVEGRGPREAGSWASGLGLSLGLGAVSLLHDQSPEGHAPERQRQQSLHGLAPTVTAFTSKARWVCQQQSDQLPCGFMYEHATVYAGSSGAYLSFSQRFDPRPCLSSLALAPVPVDRFLTVFLLLKTFVYLAMPCLSCGMRGL